jgi:hypothetical protein
LLPRFQAARTDDQPKNVVDLPKDAQHAGAESENVWKNKYPFMAKKLLIIAIVSLVAGLIFVTGIVNAQNMVGLYVVLPLGAVFLGLFLVFKSFEKEVSVYDEEQQSHPALRAETAADCGCSTHACQKSAVTR